MKCSICQGELKDSDLKTKCPECDNEYHTGCWNENGGCGTPGCKYLPDKSTKNETHYSESAYWGVENKICPACGEKIQVSALTCPYCKEEFDTNVPIEQRTYRNERSIKIPVRDGSAKIAIVVFICGMLGCTSVFNLIIGGIWFYGKRKKLKSDFPVYYFLALAGLVISLLYTLIFAFAIISSLVNLSSGV